MRGEKLVAPHILPGPIAWRNLQSYKITNMPNKMFGILANNIKCEALQIKLNANRASKFVKELIDCQRLRIIFAYIYIYIIMLNNYMNCKYLEVFLTMIWYNELFLRKLHSGRSWFFISYNLNKIVQILQMKMEYFYL